MQIWVVWAALRKAQPRGSIKERRGYTQYLLPPALFLFVSVRECRQPLHSCASPCRKCQPSRYTFTPGNKKLPLLGLLKSTGLLKKGRVCCNWAAVILHCQDHWTLRTLFSASTIHLLRWYCFAGQLLCNNDGQPRLLLLHACYFKTRCAPRLWKESRLDRAIARDPLAGATPATRPRTAPAEA